MTVRIADDGRGFDPDDPDRTDGFGLAAMRVRLAQVGGTVSVRSAPGSGTTVIVQVPA